MSAALLTGCGTDGGTGPLEGPPIVTIDLSRLALPVGSGTQVTVGVRNADGTAVSNPDLGWTSSDPQVLSVDATGRVSALNIGAATITASFDEVSALLPAAVVASARFDTDIEPLLTQRCALSGCHIAPDPPEGLDLSAGKAFGNLVRVPSGQSLRNRVQPGDPDGSYIMDKLQGTIDTADGGGARMPLNRQPLSEAEMDIVRAWIQTGAAGN